MYILNPFVQCLSTTTGIEQLVTNKSSFKFLSEIWALVVACNNNEESIFLSAIFLSLRGVYLNFESLHFCLCLNKNIA